MQQTQAIFGPIESGDLDQVERLIKDDPGFVHVRRIKKDLEGQTPLCTSAIAGHLDIVRVLVDKGARVYERTHWGYPAIEHAFWAKQKHVVDYFLREAADKALGTRGLGIEINLAARNGWTELVKKHIEKDPLSVFTRGLIGDTPLHWPAHNGHGEIVTLLLDAGAAIEADAGLYGGKPLHWAAEHEPNIVKLLLERGAQVDSRNMDDGEYKGFTPLIMCAKQPEDCVECAELLLKAGADVNAQDAEGKRALDYATEGGHKRVARALREHRA